MNVQWWIDTVGKLGPAAIASAVYLLTRRQNAWNVAVASRAAGLEDQKLRLALLDKRVGIIDVIRDAPWRFVADDVQVVMNSLTTALTTAELIFAREEVAAIRECLQNIHAWHRHSAREEAFRDKDAEKFQKAVGARSEAEGRVFDSLNQINRDLIAVARVTPLMPLSAPPSAIVQVWQHVCRRALRRKQE